MSEQKTTVQSTRIERERTQFRKLLIANPNYFGNIIGSELKAVKQIAGNTSYETLKSVGLYPESDLLEAIVYINRSNGYGGDLCSKGTPEYVRFYLSYDSGVTWQDQGVTSFQAQDIPTPKPLEYAVQLKIKPKKRICKYENLPRVRAILSWNNLPPVDTPDFIPVWGNVVEKHVQIDTMKFIIDQPISAVLNEAVLVSLLKENNVLPQNFTEAQLQTIDLDELKKEVVEGITKSSQTELTTLELHKAYQGQKVAAERYLYPAIHKLSAAGTVLNANPGMLTKANFFPNIDINISDIIDKLSDFDGNTGYEELGHVGLNTNNDTLEATINVKLPYGFLGGLCKKGSREYVAFWMDFGGGWQYVGTTSVKVHDITNIPKDGLGYAVMLPVNLNEYRQECKQGPRTAKVRAILSWEALPDPNNPDAKPVWGNREETLVLITPGTPSTPGTHLPFIETVGGMSIDDISTGGLATGTAVTAGFAANNAPFGGVIVISGHLAYPTDISAGAAPLEYRVRVSNDGGVNWQSVTNPFSIHRSQLLDGIWSTLPVVSQTAPAEWYTYREDLSAAPGNAQIFVQGNILARWNTSLPMDGSWKIKIESRVQGTLAPVWTSDSVAAVVDNRAPDVALDITSGGGVCADFTSGTVISGPYSAVDDYFTHYTLSLDPANGGTFKVLPSGGGTFTGAPSSSVLSRAPGGTGEHGQWELDTTGVPQCGYVVYLHAADRTIVDSGSIGHPSSAVVGVCIRGAKP